MALPCVFSSQTTEETLNRLSKLSAQTQPVGEK